MYVVLGMSVFRVLFFSFVIDVCLYLCILVFMYCVFLSICMYLFLSLLM